VAVPPVVVPVPVPGLVALVGAAGAGKSTLAARSFRPDEVLSSDALRAAVSGDPADQRVTRTAFGILHREVALRLMAGRLVVVDATNVERPARTGLLRLARRQGVPAIALVIATPTAEVHARNAARPGRVVPAEVVDRHLAQLARLGTTPQLVRASLLGEGFAAVHVLVSTTELVGLTIERVPLHGSA
jgi:protein phosphatase